MITSYVSFSFFKTFLKLSLIINSEGLGGIGPAVIKSKVSISDFCTQSSIEYWLIIKPLIPLSLLTLNPRWILGLRKSKSIKIVFFPDIAIIPARFKATNVFPSPEIEEVIAIV